MALAQSKEREDVTNTVCNLFAPLPSLGKIKPVSLLPFDGDSSLDYVAGFWLLCSIQKQRGTSGPSILHPCL